MILNSYSVQDYSVSLYSVEQKKKKKKKVGMDNINEFFFSCENFI